MPTLDIDCPNLPDLEFTVLITALCTSRGIVLNISDQLRTKIFDRCWVLIDESPPPRRPEKRVLDFTSWTPVTLDAMVETIRSILTEAGIRTLTWDHSASERTQVSTSGTQPLIDRFEQLHAPLSMASDTASRETVLGAPERRDNAGPDIRQLVAQIDTLMAALTPAVKRRAADLVASGKHFETVGKLLEGVDILRCRGEIYLTWARHYAALADDHGEETAETDGSWIVPS